MVFSAHNRPVGTPAGSIRQTVGVDRATEFYAFEHVIRPRRSQQAAGNTGRRSLRRFGRRTLTGLATLMIGGGLLVAYPAAETVGAAPPAPTPSRVGCAAAGPRTRDFLPQFPVGTRTVVNPCLGLTGLSAIIAELIPAGQGRKIRPFIAGIKGLATKVLAIDDLAECGYETDRLSLGIYQNRTTQWSIGVVAATRGHVDAALEISTCFLLKQIPFLPRTVAPVSGVVAPPEPDLCAQVERRSRAGQDYTVLWLGSSDVMCADLTAQLTPGTLVDDGVTATVKAVPNLAVRAGPSTTTTVIRREPAGQVLVVECYMLGEFISGRHGTSNRWYRLVSDDRTEYVAGAWLDIGDHPDRPSRCR